MTMLMKIDTQDKIRVLQLYTAGEEFIRESGEYGGALITHTRVCKGKNIGRSNETTPAEQAKLELASKVKEKVREGYVKMPDNGANLPSFDLIRRYIIKHRSSIPQAMLAKTYQTKYANYDEGVLISPKLDGIRCLAVVSPGGVKLWTRGAKEILTMNHIIKALEPMCDWVGQPVVLDGELYYHNKADDNFQEVVCAFKKYRMGISELLNYIVFDMAAGGMRAFERYKFYSNLLIKLDSKRVRCLPQGLIYTEEEVMIADKVHIETGYEGTMVKNQNSLYVPNLRSSDLLKLKQFSEGEFDIIDVIPMENQPESGLAVMRMKNGITFNATPSMNMTQRAEFLQNKQNYIGLRATIRYQGFTDKGLPRIASLKSIDRKTYEGV